MIIKEFDYIFKLISILQYEIITNIDIMFTY